ncbi:MAG: acyl-CoA dehydrogenase, partial [Caulobacteraceae bacterium]|nr:acyl-CoA dehydrogenase [Caulobacteraceae bacterium]
EECGRVVAAAPFLAAGAAVAWLLAQAGDPAGALAKVAAGETIAALAFAEGPVLTPAAPQARFENGKLTGAKTAVLGAAAADLAVVLASDASGRAVLASVELAGPDVTRKTLDTIDNSRCLADLTFENTPAVLLAGDGAVLAQGALDRLALHLSAEGVGGADACIAASVGYANERQAFGQAIGKFQAVKHAIAEMYVLNEMARASVLDAAVRLDQSDPTARTYIAAARLNAVQAYENAAAASTQVHGGIGVTWEADLHLHYRRSRAIAVEAGAPAFWEDLIASELVAQ